MNLLDNVKSAIDIINTSSKDFWYYIKIMHPIDEGVDVKRMWRKIYNGSGSVGGMSNRTFMGRYIRSGLWINYKTDNYNVMLIFFSSPKSEFTSFKRIFRIRYYSASKKKINIDVKKINPENNTLFKEVGDIITTEMNIDLDPNDIPTDIKINCFGELWKIKYEEKKHKKHYEY